MLQKISQIVPLKQQVHLNNISKGYPIQSDSALPFRLTSNAHVISMHSPFNLQDMGRAHPPPLVLLPNLWPVRQ